MLLLLSTLTIILYLINTALQASYAKNYSEKFEIITTSLGFFTIFIHTILWFLLIRSRQNLSLLTLISLGLWLINLIIYSSALKNKSIKNLGLFSFPVTAICLALPLFFNQSAGIIDISDAKQLFHVLLSTLTFTTIFFASLQAIILTIQDRTLRKHHRVFTTRLPSIESMENFLFQTLTLGFLLLTILLFTSIILFFVMDSHKLINKLILSFSVWLVLAILLGGRLYSGWRGSTVTRWTLLGASLLMLIYFGSLFNKYILNIPCKIG